MPDSKDAALLAQLAVELLSQPRGEVTTDLIVERALEVAPDAEHASITIRSKRRKFRTAAATSTLARSADLEQYARQEGPCLEAATRTHVLRSGDVRADSRWPSWGPAAAEVGVGSLLSVTLRAHEQALGSLNLYSTKVGAFSDNDEVDATVLYAGIAGSAMSVARTVNGLETAMKSRHQIGMAQGMLMERYGLDATQSFALLQRLSSTRNRKLRVVAEDVTNRRELPILDALEFPEPDSSTSPLELENDLSFED
jgi:hypothetical protein